MYNLILWRVVDMVVTVEPRMNKVPRHSENMFAITRFRYNEVLFHIFYYYWGEEYCSLQRGHLYIKEVRYIEVLGRFIVSL